MSGRDAARLRVVNNQQADITLERPLPRNEEAEQFILGAIMLDNATMNQAAEKLKADDFFHAGRKTVYKHMLAIYERGEGIDPVMLQEEMRRAGELDAVGGPAFIASLFDGMPRFSDITNYIKIVKGKSLLRRTISVLNKGMAECFDDSEMPETILAGIEREILEMSQETIKKDFVRAGDIADKQLEAIENRTQSEQVVTGLAVGFHEVDYMTSGMQKGDLIIIAARPSMGKTAYAINCARNAAGLCLEEGARPVVGVFSLEMSSPQLIDRLLCSDARVDSHRVRMGCLSKDEWRRLAIAVGEISELNLYFDDTPAITLTEMRAKARKLKAKHGRLDLLVIDYLQLMGSTGGSRGESRQQEVSKISRGLKMLAKELEVPVVALSQLSRATENRSTHKPQLSDLRESGAIEQDADVVMFLHREDYYNPETEKQNITEVIIGKQRNGPVGSVELVFLKQLMRFEDKYRESGGNYNQGDAE